MSGQLSTVKWIRQASWSDTEMTGCFFYLAFMHLEYYFQTNNFILFNSFVIKLILKQRWFLENH